SSALSPLGFPEARMTIAAGDMFTDSFGVADLKNLHAESLQQIPSGGFISAIVQLPDGTTSEVMGATPLQLESIEVTNTADDGAGSLRDAIRRANNSSCTFDTRCWITFHIADGDAHFEPKSPLQVITSSYVVIDGKTQAWWNDAAVEISGASLSNGDG